MVQNAYTIYQAKSRQRSICKALYMATTTAGLQKVNARSFNNQPKLLSLNGPMWNGWGTLKSTGETVAIIRYEKPCKY